MIIQLLLNIHDPLDMDNSVFCVKRSRNYIGIKFDMDKYEKV